MTVLKAIIFDVYETLYANGQDLWLRAFEEICQGQGLPLDAPKLWQEWRKFEGDFRKTRTCLSDPPSSPPFKTYEEAWRDAFDQTFNVLGIKGDAADAARISVVHMGRRPAYHDALETLPQLRKGPWKLCVFSNADNSFLYPVLEQTPLTTFDVVMSSESARAYKPDPRAFLRVAEAAGVTPEEALYIGDTLYDDIHGARRINMRAVWLNRKGDARPMHDDLEPPDFVARSLEELPVIIESLEEATHA